MVPPSLQPAAGPSETPRIAVEARNASKAFGQGDALTRALDDVSVAIRKGEFFTLLGPSGCGKTTTMRMVAGLEHPTLGEVAFDGKRMIPMVFHGKVRTGKGPACPARRRSLRRPCPG